MAVPGVVGTLPCPCPPVSGSARCGTGRSGPAAGGACPGPVRAGRGAGAAGAGRRRRARGSGLPPVAVVTRYLPAGPSPARAGGLARPCLPPSLPAAADVTPRRRSGLPGRSPSPPAAPPPSRAGRGPSVPGAAAENKGAGAGRCQRHGRALGALPGPRRSRDSAAA